MALLTWQVPNLDRNTVLEHLRELSESISLSANASSPHPTFPLSISAVDAAPAPIPSYAPPNAYTPPPHYPHPSHQAPPPYPPAPQASEPTAADLIANPNARYCGLCFSTSHGFGVMCPEFRATATGSFKDAIEVSERMFQAKRANGLLGKGNGGRNNNGNGSRNAQARPQPTTGPTNPNLIPVPTFHPPPPPPTFTRTHPNRVNAVTFDNSPPAPYVPSCHHHHAPVPSPPPWEQSN